jgi:hypothetical protein
MQQEEDSWVQSERELRDPGVKGAREKNKKKKCHPIKVIGKKIFGDGAYGVRLTPFFLLYDFYKTTSCP